MKKNLCKIALVGAALLSLAACGKVSEPSVNLLENAKSYVFNLYKGGQSKDEAEELSLNLKRVTSVTINGEVFTVTWTVDSTKVTIENSGNNQVVIKPDFTDLEGYEFVLTATITGSDGSTTTQTFRYEVPAYFVPGWKNCILLDAATLVENATPFYYGLYQATLDKVLYFSGEVSGNYLALSEHVGDAAATYLEAFGDGYAYAFYDKTGAKKYFEVYDYSGGGKNGVHICDTPTNPGYWNAELGQLRYTVGTGTFYMGTYSSYNTISSSNVTYIDGEANRAKIDISQFPARSFSTDVAHAEGKIVKELSEDLTFKAGFYQKAIGKFLWFNGEPSGNYLGTSTNGCQCPEMHAEKVGDGWRIYFLEGETKQYIEVYDYSGGGKNGVHITTDPVNVGTWNDELYQLRYVVGTGTFYMGTYSTYNTISSSNVSYIDGETNRAKVDDSQFVMRFYM